MYSRERVERYHGWYVEYREYRSHSKSAYDSQRRYVERGLTRHPGHYNHYHPYQRPPMYPDHVHGSHRDIRHRSSQRPMFEHAPFSQSNSRDRASTRDRRQRSVKPRAVEEKRHTARHHSYSRGRSSTTDKHATCDRQQSPVGKVHVPVEVTAAPEPPVTFPELWGTYVTEADDRQIDQWRRETGDKLTSTPCSIRDGCKTGSRKRLYEDDNSEFLPPAKVFINKEHARFRHLF